MREHEQIDQKRVKKGTEMSIESFENVLEVLKALQEQIRHDDNFIDKYTLADSIKHLESFIDQNK